MLKNITIWGRHAPLGLLLIVISFATDQAHKWWMLYVYDIGKKKPVPITPFFDLTLVWNPGVSYGWLNTLGPWLLIGGQLLISALLWIWLTGAKDRTTAMATGLIIGGALGNVADRIIYHAVADFFHLHAFGYNWYVFNLADVAIVVGAAILVYGTVSDMRRSIP